MKSRSLLATSLLLLAIATLSLPAQERQRSPEPTEIDTSAPRRVRIQINDKIIDVDSIVRHFDVNDGNFDLDLDVDVDTDVGFDSDDVNLQLDETFNSEEFQQKMKAFQEKMQQFQVKMKEWQERYKEKMERWQEQYQDTMDGLQEQMKNGFERMELELEAEEMGQGDGSSDQVLRFRNGDSNVVILSRRMRVRDENVRQNAAQIDSLRQRVERLQKELKGMKKGNARRSTLEAELADTRAELNDIERMNRRLRTIVIANGNGPIAWSEAPLAWTDSTFMGIGSTIGEGLAFAASGLDSLGTGQHKFMLKMRADSADGCGHGVSIIASHARNGEPMKNFMMRIGAEDSSCNGVESRLLIKTLSFTGDPSSLSPQAMVFDEGALQLQRSELVIEGDTVRLADGRDGQTVIRIDHGQSPDGKAQVVIMSIRRGAGKDAAKSTSAPLPPGVAGYALGENYPNPVATSTTIDYTLPQPARATISIFDNTGRLVKTVVDQEMPAGAQSVVVDASDLPSGLYLYRLVSGSFSETKTMTVTR